MLTEELNYYLPPELIAQRPAADRTASRLLALDRSDASMVDTGFANIGRYLRGGDCLVLNDTKVIPAKFFARKPTGGRIGGLFLAEKAGAWEVMLKGARSVKPGQVIYLSDHKGEDFCPARAIEKLQDGRWLLQVEYPADAETILGEIGFAPLPPYIKREKDSLPAEMDQKRYQTVYASRSGAVAAPTAGLHFTNEPIEELKSNGICFAYITLHVGARTFKPITAGTLEEHKIHSEWYAIDEKNAEIINNAKKNRQRVIAVGTTSVRVLETVAEGHQVKPGSGQTNLFITPGCKFQIVDAMLTNFHLPKSSLIALVAAFAGTETTLSAYQHAIEEKYRFYSYGDAMLIM